MSILEEVSPYFKIISDGIERATNIVSSLSHYSRQSDDFNELCNVNAILDNTFIILSDQLKRKGIKIEKKFSTTETLSVIGNEGKLHQVLLNILNNSIQAIDKKNGLITISIWNDKKYVCISIKDNGHGIKEENMSRIKDPFFTTKSVGEGTGLGLFITYKIIEEHNGSMEIKSIENEGTECVIKLPIRNQAVNQID